MLRTICFIAGAVFVTFYRSVLSIMGGLINPYSDFTNRMIRNWAKTIIRISGISLSVEGQQNTDISKSYIYMANHQGNFDILVSALTIPGTARFVAKKELFKFPVFAQAMKLVGMIPIDRAQSTSARNTLHETVRKLKPGVSVIVFPEGTRSRDGAIQPFKKGGFIMALEGKIPIVPVSISGSFHAMEKTSFRLRKGRIKVHFSDPVNTDNYSYDTRNKLIADVRKIIADNFDPDYK